jgi:hypothetical protein
MTHKALPGNRLTVSTNIPEAVLLMESGSNPQASQSLEQTLNGYQIKSKHPLDAKTPFDSLA